MNFQVNKKENLYFIIMAIISIFSYGLICYKFPIALIYVAFFIIFSFIASTLFIGHIKGNAIKITENQFPEIFEILKEQSEKLDLKKTPEMYVLQGNGMLNAFATRFAKKDFVVIFSDVFDALYQEDKNALSFIIGHELGHIKRNHISLIKILLTLPARCIPALGSAYSRACEFTCDNIGYNLAPQESEKGLLVLAAGKKLYKNINVEELINTYKNNQDFTSRFSEYFSTHPHIINRINVLRSENKAI